MAERSDRWIVTADSRCARFFHCTRSARGTWHIDEGTEALVNAWEGSHERHRPAILGKGLGTVPPHTAAPGHTEDEEQRRFAIDTARWLQKKLKEVQPSPIVVFAAPRFVAVLRAELPKAVQQHVQIIEMELAKLRPHELAEHPAVLSALESA